MRGNHLKIIEHIQHWVSNVDTKASIILAITGLLFSVICANNELLKTILKSFIDIKELLNHNFDALVSFGISFSCFLAVIFGIRTFYFLYKVLIGRIKPGIFKQERLDTDSNFFFRNNCKEELYDL